MFCYTPIHTAFELRQCASCSGALLSEMHHEDSYEAGLQCVNTLNCAGQLTLSFCFAATHLANQSITPKGLKGITVLSSKGKDEGGREKETGSKRGGGREKVERDIKDCALSLK